MLPLREPVGQLARPNHGHPPIRGGRQNPHPLAGRFQDDDSAFEASLVVAISSMIGSCR